MDSCGLVDARREGRVGVVRGGLDRERVRRLDAVAARGGAGLVGRAVGGLVVFGRDGEVTVGGRRLADGRGQAEPVEHRRGVRAGAAPRLFVEGEAAPVVAVGVARDERAVRGVNFGGQIADAHATEFAIAVDQFGRGRRGRLAEPFRERGRTAAVPFARRDHRNTAVLAEHAADDHVVHDEHLEVRAERGQGQFDGFAIGGIGGHGYLLPPRRGIHG